MTKYEELVQAAESAAKREVDRRSAATKFSQTVMQGLASYMAAPTQTLVFLPWNEHVGRFDDYDAGRMVPVRDSIHWDQATSRWQFSFFLRLNQPQSIAYSGVSIIVTFVELDSGYMVRLGEAEPTYVDINVQSTRESFFESVVYAVRAFYAEPEAEPEDEDNDDTGDVDLIDGNAY